MVLSFSIKVSTIVLYRLGELAPLEFLMFFNDISLMYPLG